MLGTILRKEREGQNLSLKEIESAISIRTKYLDAIENERYGELPGEVYVKGFIRNYAKFLGLDADTIMKVYNEDKLSLTQALTLPVGGDEIDDDAALAAPVIDAATIKRARAKEAEAAQGGSALFASGDDFRQRTESHAKRYALLAAGLLAVAVIGSVFYFFGDEHSAPTATPTSVAADTQRPDDSPAAAAPLANGVEVVATFNARCWTYVVADGQPVFEATTNAGDRHTWTGRERVDITLGNAGAATVMYNGRNFGTLGKVGAVVEKHFISGNPEPVDASARKEDSPEPPASTARP